MRQRRKCLYKNCGHSQGDNVLKCSFFRFPKDTITARRWLNLSGVHDQTPKKILSHWCLCSCHFPSGRSNGPEELIEEYDDVVPCEIVSPPCKTRKVQAITPSTSAAVEALMTLKTTDEFCQASAQIIVEPMRRSTPRYSPSRKLWSLRNKQVLQASRSAMVPRALDFDDLGVETLPEDEETLPEDEETQNVTPTIITEIFETNTPILSNEEEPSVAPQKKNMRSIGIQCNRPFLCYDRVKLLPQKDFKFYTGVTQEMFEVLYCFLGEDKICNQLKYRYDRGTPKKEPCQGELSSKDKLLLTLLRLRRGIPLRDLKVLFDISESHASRVFYTWIRFMSLEFKKLEEVMFVPAAHQKELKPKCFEMFENLRVVIDAVEFKIQKPKHLQQNSNTFSEYKNYNTAKFLVGISCFCGLSFISEGYEGSMSDRKIVLDSGFLDHLQAGDGVMGDRGFDIEDLTDEREVDLYIPAFQHGRNSFTGRELILSRAIAESRVHVEIFMARIKEFRLVRYQIPNTQLAVVSDIVKVCAHLVNFQQPFIKLGGGEEEQFL